MQFSILNIEGSTGITKMYFEILKSAPGKYWWRMKASGNHAVIAHSEILNSKTTCLHAINIVKGSAYSAKVYDQTGE